MASPSTPIALTDKQQQGLLEYSKSCQNYFKSNYNIIEQLTDIDLAYQREQIWNKEHQRAKLANRYGDAAKFQDVEIPIVMPQVETAVTYQTSVFLTGVPLFGVAASPKYIDAAVQMETILDAQAIRGGWVAELIKTFRDGFKYNIGATEIGWGRTITATVETDLAFDSKLGRPKEVVYEGNRVKRLDPYNTFWDTRVALSAVHTDGEFAGYNSIISRIALKKFIAELPDKRVSNIRPAFESPTSMEYFHIPQINPDALIDRSTAGGFNWDSWATLAGSKSNIAYADFYVLTKLYIRLLPSDFDIRVPSRNTPQVWLLYIVNNSVIIYAERQTNAHDLIPILFISPMDDGLDYQTKSFAHNIKGIQHTASAFQASAMASRRRAISDRTLYNPSLINAADINNPNPSAKIPVKPNAYGRALSEAVYPFPFRDDQASIIMSELPGIMRFADIISGQNPAQQGQFVKGNKTRKEFSDIMGNANGRNQLMALVIESQLFTPMKEILKLNILQYQGGTSLYNREKEQEIEIDPITLRKAVIEFKLSDGLIPTDKLINAEAFHTTIQTLGSSPEISAAYNIGPMFSYLMKTQGAHISAFEKPPEQLQYEKAMRAWQQAVSVLIKEKPEIKQDQYPPQPKLVDFGLNEQGMPVKEKAAAKEPPTIMETLMTIEEQGNGQT